MGSYVSVDDPTVEVDAFHWDGTAAGVLELVEFVGVDNVGPHPDDPQALMVNVGDGVAIVPDYWLVRAKGTYSRYDHMAFTQRFTPAPAAASPAKGAPVAVAAAPAAPAPAAAVVEPAPVASSPPAPAPPSTVTTNVETTTTAAPPVTATTGDTTTVSAAPPTPAT
jgi:hypothetical protein